jgi:hydroxyacylglutathione hydrolase
MGDKERRIMNKHRLMLILLLMTVGLVSASGQNAAAPRVLCQVSGPFKVQSYLVYDPASKEAVLIDAGSSLDWLLAAVDEERLQLKLVFLTHAHQDHVAGLPFLKDRLPGVKLCYSRLEFEDRGKYQDWRALFDAKSVALWKADPEMRALMDFDYGQLPPPDIDPRDGQELPLGSLRVRVLLTPGHTRGGITLAVGKALFPGDLLLYHATGDMSYPLCSRDEIVSSIRRLYDGFADDTIVYSGHGESSTIGFEKVHNQNVTASEVKWLP